MTALADRVKTKSDGKPYGFDWRWVPIADLNIEELPEAYDWRAVIRWIDSTFDGEVVVTVEENGELTAFLCVEETRSDHPSDTEAES